MPKSCQVFALLFKPGLGPVGLIALIVVGLIAYVGLKKHRYSNITDTRDLPKRIDALATHYLGKRKNCGLVSASFNEGSVSSKVTVG